MEHDRSAAEKPFQIRSISIASKDALEECFHLNTDESVDYRVQATGSVSFNVHYHEGGEVFEPVKHDDMVSEEGNYLAKIGQDYCMMWLNRDGDPMKLG